MRFQIAFTVLELIQVQIQVKNFILQVIGIDPLDLQLICFEQLFENQVDYIVQLVMSSNVATLSIYLSRILIVLEVLLI